MNFKRIIGLIIGIMIITIGIYSLISNIGFIITEVDETIGLGKSTSYQIHSDKHATQIITIIGEKFDLKLTSPSNGLQIPETPHTKKVYLEWVHLQDGDTLINIKNTGSSDLHVIATFEVTAKPILFYLIFVVIITGMIIIGFSTKSVKKIKELSES